MSPYATLTTFGDILKEVYPPRKRGKDAIQKPRSDEKVFRYGIPGRIAQGKSGAVGKGNPKY